MRNQTQRRWFIGWMPMSGYPSHFTTYDIVIGAVISLLVGLAIQYNLAIKVVLDHTPVAIQIMLLPVLVFAIFVAIAGVFSLVFGLLAWSMGNLNRDTLDDEDSLP